MLSGGAFGNEKCWLLDSIKRTTRLYDHQDLEVAIVCYGAADPEILQLITQFSPAEQ